MSVCFRGSDPTSLPNHFAWLVGGLLCHGHLLLPATTQTTTTSSNNSKKAAAAGKPATAAAAASSSSWVVWGRQAAQPAAAGGDGGGDQGEIEDAGLYVGDMRQLWLGGEGEGATTPEEEPLSMVRAGKGGEGRGRGGKRREGETRGEEEG